MAAPVEPVQAQLQAAPCMADFMKLRREAERRGNAIKAASKRKASPAEACGLIESYLDADLKMLIFVEANQMSCGIPSNVPDGMRQNRSDVEGLRGRVCAAAEAGAQQRRQQGPSFSDELGKRIKRDFKIWHDPPNCRAADCLTVSPVVEHAVNGSSAGGSRLNLRLPVPDLGLALLAATMQRSDRLALSVGEWPAAQQQPRHSRRSAASRSRRNPSSVRPRPFRRSAVAHGRCAVA